MTAPATARGEVEAALAAAGVAPTWGAARGRVLRCDVARDASRRAAQALLSAGMELALMLANDRRKDRGVFEVRLLFEPPQGDWFLEMVEDVPAGDPRFESIATLSYPASRYEREIRDQFGLRPEGHPDPRPLVRHGFWPETFHPMLKDSPPPGPLQDDGSPFPFRQVQGEGLYEIPVGPVHAGIIEPGHFRFSVDGETILDMKARLYFTHKGTEKLFEGKDAADGVGLAERISGDTSVGHPLAYCQAVEALAGIEPPRRALLLRVVLLELERLYNHVGDFGAIAGDTGFSFAQAHGARLRERLLRLNKALCGHRLLRGTLVPGGLGRDLPIDAFPGRELRAIGAEFDALVAVSQDSSILVDRVRGAGRLSHRTAADHGVLGYVARASGIDRDARRDHPFAAYGSLPFRVPVLEAGDVEARVRVRVEEFRESIGLIERAIEALRPGPVRAAARPLPPWESGYGVVEGWRGAIVHWIMADGAGALHRVKVRDPSFVNWRALTFALLKNIVPDFPLCNKSFNLSYSGNDL